MFFLMYEHILAERSTKVATIAPRETASRPIIPGPEHRSRNRRARTRRERILNITSRNRRDVTLFFEPGTLSRSFPRSFPSVTCISDVIFTLSVLFHGPAAFPAVRAFGGI